MVAAMNSNPNQYATVSSSSDEHEDRLSSLPDCIICHILSFMPTKNTAITSILSTRWRYIFLAVPKIDLQDSTLASLNADFIHFVNRCLVLRMTSSLTEFQLKRVSLPEPGVISLWLIALSFRKVKVLQISETSKSNSPSCPLNFYLSRFKNLVVLKLRCFNVVFHIPEFVCFPYLKVLELKWLALHFEHENLRFAEDSFPLLEDLTLNAVRFPDGKNKAFFLGISLPTLRILSIIKILLPVEDSRIDIDAPHLQHFICDVDAETPINLSNCECLVSADLAFGSDIVDSADHWFPELLRKVNNVMELKLFLVIEEHLSLTEDSLPVFPNLTSLDATINWELQWILLQRAPNLTKLHCTLLYNFVDNILDPENEPEPECFAQNLRRIRITDFEGHDDDLAKVKYFLGHGAALERMIINGPFLSEIQKFESSTLPQLKKIRPCSPACEIELTGAGLKYMLNP